MRASTLIEPMFVGRKKELAKLQQQLNSAIKGEGSSVFISGETGSGKSRLVLEFLKIAKAENIQIISGWCLNNSTLPYFPFIEAFNSYLSTNQTLVRNIKGLNSALIELNHFTNREMQPETWKDITFSVIAEELLYISEVKPLILFIDDIQWADSGSLALIHYLSKKILNEKILIISAFKMEEANSTNVSALKKTLQLMNREGLFENITLEPLHQKDTKTIAEKMVGAKLDETSVNKLYNESQGNPLFLVEILRILIEQKRFQWESEHCFLDAKEIELPSKIRDVINRRLEYLGIEERRIVDASSIIGKKFDAGIVALLVNKEHIEVLELLRNITQTHLVQADGKLYSFEHSKYQELVYDELPLPLRIAYHLKLAQILENKYAIGESEVEEIAVNYIKAQNWNKAIEFSFLSGQKALEQFSNIEAIKHFQFVLEKTKENKQFLAQHLIAAEGLGDALFANSMFNDAAYTFEALSQTVDGTIKLRILRKAMNARFAQGSIHRLLSLIQQAENLSSQNRLENARILYQKGRALILQGDFEAALYNYERALKISEEENSPRDVASVLLGVGVARIYAGKNQEGVGAVLKAILLLGQFGDFRRQIEGYYLAAYQLMILGFPEKSIFFANRAVAIANKLLDYNSLSDSYAILSYSQSSLGYIGDAISSALTALQYSKKADSKLTQAIIFNALARFYYSQGNQKKADKFYNKLMDLSIEELKNPMLLIPFTKAIFCFGNKNEAELNAYFKQSIEISARIGPGLQALVRETYAKYLALLGQTVEAKKELNQAQKIMEKTVDEFKEFNLQITASAPSATIVNQPFEVKLDIVNVSLSKGLLCSIQFPNYIKIVATKKGNINENSFSITYNKSIDSFESESIYVTIDPQTAGDLVIEAQILCQDEDKRSTRMYSKPVLINVQPKEDKSYEDKTVESGSNLIKDIIIKTEVAAKVFEFLLSSFVNDYMKRRLTLEQSGWKSLNEIVTKKKVPKSQVYGQNGRLGKSIIEIDRLGLIEIRIFPGERGRGGKIIKIRLNQKRDVVKRIIDDKYIAIKEK